MFEPTQEPAKSIYKALVLEATKRKGRSSKEWIKAERVAVFEEATRLAHALGLREPSLAQVIEAENRALGHADYAAKFAYGVSRVMLIPDGVA